MTNQSVNELACTINKNDINDTLLKAEALLRIALNSSLQDEPTYIIHDYLWALSDLVSNARKLVSNT